MRAWFPLVVLAIVLGGCADSSGTKAPPDPELESGSEQGNNAGHRPGPIASMMVSVRAGRSIWDEYRFEYVVIEPNGTGHIGAQDLRVPRDTACWSNPTCPGGPDKFEGELSGPNGEDSIYPSFRMPSSSYEGNWTFRITRAFSRSLVEPAVPPPNHCAYVLISEPNNNLGPNGSGWESPMCTTTGVVQFDFARQEWSLVEGAINPQA